MSDRLAQSTQQNIVAYIPTTLNIWLTNNIIQLILYMKIILYWVVA